MTHVDAALLAAAWVAGFAGSGHCLGMCGGIAASVSLGGRRTRGAAAALFAATHAGRIFSYAVAGAAVGLAGAAAAAPFGGHGLSALRLAGAVLVTAVGLQLLLGRRLLAPVERLGARLWTLAARPLRGLVPPRGPGRAFALGALWGWLPCGLVYAELTVAAVAGGALQGAAVMSAFGLGTVLGFSALGMLLQALRPRRLPRQLGGALLLLLGLWIALPLGGHSMHAVHAVQAMHTPQTLPAQADGKIPEHSHQH